MTFECLVHAVDDECVECEAHEVNSSNPVEFAEVYLSTFPADIRPLLVEGAVFYWWFESGESQIMVRG